MSRLGYADRKGESRFRPATFLLSGKLSGVYMHYYLFNIADYRKDTSHLTPIEHYIYRFLLDWAYLDEKPIPLDTNFVLRKLGLTSKNLSNLDNVLNDFFKRSDSGWHQRRIDEAITEYHNYLKKQAENGSKGGRPRKPTANPPISDGEAKKSLTINHKPITINDNKGKIPDDFAISENVKKWAIENNYMLSALESHKRYFVTACKANGYVKDDWDAYFIKAIVDNWAKLQNPKGGVVL